MAKFDYKAAMKELRGKIAFDYPAESQIVHRPEIGHQARIQFVSRGIQNIYSTARDSS